MVQFYIELCLIIFNCNCDLEFRSQHHFLFNLRGGISKTLSTFNRGFGWLVSCERNYLIGS